MTRVRLRYTKVGKVRFTSHRDVARLFERALRRAQLPVASTEGFSPRPRLHFGLALPTGGESQGEYLDIDFRDPGDGPGAPDHAVDVDALPGLLSPLLPVGLDVERAEPVDRKAPSLQEAVVGCVWRIEVPDLTADELRAAAAALLAAPAIPVARERKGKVVQDDIRPNLEGLRVDDDGALVAELATQPRGVRPSELVAAIGTVAGRPELEAGRISRTHQWIVLDGALREPLPPGATGAPRTEVRV